jgi:uncharacterized damage-inducible protein DinB
MSIAIRNFTIDCTNPALVCEFWAGVLGFVEDPLDPNLPDHHEWVLIDPSGRYPRLLFIRVPEPKTVKNRVHFDLQPQLNSRDVTVNELIVKGATVVEDHRKPDGTGWVTMADPEGNEFCVERSTAERAANVSEPSTYRFVNSLTDRCGDERTEILGMMDLYRQKIVDKVANLDQARARASVTFSNTTIIGLVKHLAYVEDYWLSVRLLGVDVEPWASAPWDQDSDWEFTTAKTDDLKAVVALYRESCERSRETVRKLTFDERSKNNPGDNPTVSLRWIMIHLIEETARHLGHLDILRELADGQTGD